MEKSGQGLVGRILLWAAKYRAMSRFDLLLSVFILLVISAACSKNAKPEDSSVWKKIKLDFSRIDNDGLAGPVGGKVSVHYEFCIPASDKYLKEIEKTDPSARVQKGSRGRIGCDKASWLVVGSTHQKNYRRVLYELASLPYVQKIEETFFE